MHLSRSSLNAQNIETENKIIITTQLYSDSLEDYIESLSKQKMTRRNQLSDDDKNTNLRIAEQLLDVLSYIHQNNIVHRDIKPANIFTERDETGKINVRVGDFGLHTKGNWTINTGGGTPYYMSPEALESKFSRPSMDVWAMGVTLVELFYPFDSEMVLEDLQSSCTVMKRKPHDPQASVNVDSQIQALLCGMLDPSPRRRITAPQALQAIRAIRQSQHPRP